MIPDAEKLVGDYLRQHPDVQALDTRILGQTPSDDSTSWVRLTQINAPFADRGVPGRLVEWYGQFDCYAGRAGIDGSQQKEAALLARTIHGALAELQGQNYTTDAGVVSGANPNLGLRHPDPDFEPARERFICTATIWMHA